jgi:hypothetical protein
VSPQSPCLPHPPLYHTMWRNAFPIEIFLLFFLTTGLEFLTLHYNFLQVFSNVHILSSDSSKPKSECQIFHYTLKWKSCVSPAWFTCLKTLTQEYHFIFLATPELIGEIEKSILPNRWKVGSKIQDIKSFSDVLMSLECWGSEIKVW